MFAALDCWWSPLEGQSRTRPTGTVSARSRIRPRIFKVRDVLADPGPASSRFRVRSLAEAHGEHAHVVPGAPASSRRETQNSLKGHGIIHVASAAAPPRPVLGIIRKETRQLREALRRPFFAASTRGRRPPPARTETSSRRHRERRHSAAAQARFLHHVDDVEPDPQHRGPARRGPRPFNREVEPLDVAVRVRVLRAPAGAEPRSLGRASAVGPSLGRASTVAADCRRVGLPVPSS